MAQRNNAGSTRHEEYRRYGNQPREKGQQFMKRRAGDCRQSREVSMPGQAFAAVEHEQKVERQYHRKWNGSIFGGLVLRRRVQG